MWGSGIFVPNQIRIYVAFTTPAAAAISAEALFLSSLITGWGQTRCLVPPWQCCRRTSHPPAQPCVENMPAATQLPDAASEVLQRM